MYINEAVKSILKKCARVVHDVLLSPLLLLYDYVIFARVHRFYYGDQKIKEVHILATLQCL